MIAIFYASTRHGLNEKEQEQKKVNKEQQQNYIACESLSVNHDARVIFYKSLSAPSSMLRRLHVPPLPPPLPPIPPPPIPTPTCSSV